MSLSASLTEVGRAVAYYPRLAQFFGSVNAAILFAQLHYWQDKGSNPELGIYKSSDELTSETGLSYREQATARGVLRDGGFLVETNRRLEHRIYFKLDPQAIDAAYQAWTEAQSANDENAFRETTKAQPAKSAKRISPAKKKAFDELRKTHSVNSTKITQEITSKSTALSLSGGAAATPETREPMRVVSRDGTVYEIPAELHYPGEDTKTHKTWIAYAIAYEKRYKSWPVWNARMAGQISKFIERIGVERSPLVAVHYVRRVNEEFIVKQMHPVKLLLSDAEKWATQHQTGASMTSTRAKQADQLEANSSVATEAMAILRAQRAAAQQGGGNAE